MVELHNQYSAKGFEGVAANADQFLELPYDKDLIVRIKLKLRSNGTVLSSEILDKEKMKDGYYKVLAESTLRAIKLCEPLRVPSSGYENWKELVLTFNPKEFL